MRRQRLILCLAAACAGFPIPASFAQPSNNDGGQRAILFDQPNFQGTSITIVQRSADLEAQGFAGRAMSAHFDGDWTICDAPGYRGRCQTVAGDVTDLGAIGLSRRLTSLRQSVPDTAADASGRGGEDEYYDRGAAPSGKRAPAAEEAPPPIRHSPAPTTAAIVDQGVAGHSVIFFVRPQRGGADVEGQGRAAADAFCRDQNLGPALYYDTDSATLRDILCRRD
jgi:hypothetical protein